MDPNATLDRLIHLMKWYRSVQDGRYTPSVQSRREYSDEFTRLFDGLNEWLSNGGFPPDAWVKNQR